MKHTSATCDNCKKIIGQKFSLLVAEKTTNKLFHICAHCHDRFNPTPYVFETDYLSPQKIAANTPKHARH